MSREPFLTRWSRRKLGTQREDPSELASVPEACRNQSPEPVPSATTPTAPDVPPVRPELPSLDSIDLDNGVADFFRPDVAEGLRRMALKKLFSDPHFNTMDGLDVYIDDYSRPDPIPPDILDRLVQAQTRLPDQDESAKPGEKGARPDGPAAVSLTDGTMAAMAEPGAQEQGQGEQKTRGIHSSK